MKILVPVDGSAHSLKALETAADFAKSKQADIYVISVALSIGGMEGHELSPNSRELHDDTQQQRADEAIKTDGEVLKKHEVDVRVSRTLSTSVSIPDAVIDFAKTEQIDLIVLGSRGLSARADSNWAASPMRWLNTVPVLCILSRFRRLRVEFGSCGTGPPDLEHCPGDTGTGVPVI